MAPSCCCKVRAERASRVPDEGEFEDSNAVVDEFGTKEMADAVTADEPRNPGEPLLGGRSDPITILEVEIGFKSGRFYNLLAGCLMQP